MISLDSAILRFSDNVIPANPLRDQWHEVFKVNFNSKVRFMCHFPQLDPYTAML